MEDQDDEDCCLNLIDFRGIIERLGGLNKEKCYPPAVLATERSMAFA
jgi:hypothetical protein